MHNAKRLMALCLVLLLLMLNAALAETSFLVHSSDWNLKDTPVEVWLAADVDTHMPFDDDRLALLTPLIDQLSLRLVTGEDEGLVTVDIAGQEVLHLQYRGNEAQLSSVQDVTYTAESDPLSLLLGADVSVEGGYELLGLSREGESLLDDGAVLLNGIPAVFDEYGKRSQSTTEISGYGLSAYRFDYTIAADQADVVQALLLSVCPEGWLRQIIEGLTFSGKQTLRIYYDENDVLLRAEYNGTCGPEGDLRTVKVVVRSRHDDEVDKDYLEVTSPAKKGKNKNNLTFERTSSINKQGQRVLEGEYSYTVTKDEVTSIRKGQFNLTNAFTDTADVISGTATFQSKLNDAEKYDSISLSPELTISGSPEAPVISGTLTVTEEYADRTTEQAVLSVRLNRAEPLVWTERSQTVNLSGLTPEALADVQNQAASSIATAIVHPLIVMMGEDAQWFFKDLPQDAVQSIIDAAEMPVQ